MPAPSAPDDSDIARARRNLEEILARCLRHSPGNRALLIFDEASPLARILSRAYRDILPGAREVEFSAARPEEAAAAAGSLAPGNLVVLVESESFRLAKFRFRMELFRLGLKVIEHPHLGRMREEEIPVYIDSLAYDEEQFGRVAPALKERIDRAREIRLIGEGTELLYDSAFETARLNTGDYRGSANVGGQFPIGEVFTEPKDVERVSGTVKLFAFGDVDFTVNAPATPFTAVVERGCLVETRGAPPAFEAVLEQIRAGEGRVWLRELGFGLNRAMTRERRVTENGAYERMCGIHLSLGAKHAIYPKPSFPKKTSRFHVDVFADLESVEVDGETVFWRGRYTL